MYCHFITKNYYSLLTVEISLIEKKMSNIFVLISILFDSYLEALCGIIIKCIWN